MKDTKMTKHNSQFFNTFTLEGTYTGSVTKGESEDWKEMSKRVNESLEQLAQKNGVATKLLQHTSSIIV